MPILVLVFGLLVFACLFTSGRDIPMVLVTYFFNVQLYSLLLELVIIYLNFIDDYYFAININLTGKTHTLFSIGNRYAELIVYHNLAMNKDYILRTVSLCGVVTIHTIINREVAIKAGILQKRTIEMINSQSSSVKATVNKQVGSALNKVESLWDYFTRKPVVYYEDDAVSGSNIPLEDGDSTADVSAAAATHANNYKEYAPISPETMHNISTSPRVSGVEAHDFSMDVIYGDKSTIIDKMTNGVDEAIGDSTLSPSIDVDSTPHDVLMKQYLEESVTQSTDVQRIDLTGLSTEEIDEILFEEWKSKKQKRYNKVETRRSFIKAYNIFENLFGITTATTNRSEVPTSLASTVNPLLATREVQKNQVVIPSESSKKDTIQTTVSSSEPTR